MPPYVCRLARVAMHAMDLWLPLRFCAVWPEELDGKAARRRRSEWWGAMAAWKGSKGNLAGGQAPTNADSTKPAGPVLAAVLI